MAMDNNYEYHIPVLLNESVSELVQSEDGTYVDVTFGGGGHSREILSRLGPSGRLFAFDQDQDALKNVMKDKKLTFVPQNFAYVRNNLRLHRVRSVDGLLADLGVSSHQFDTGERGFSTRFDGELDMRMDQKSKLSAKQIVNEFKEEDLTRIFKLYGELKNARSVASKIVYMRAQSPINTVEELKLALIALAPNGKHASFYAKVFQAIRIEVNQEMEVLKMLLEQMTDVIAEGGRIVFITYHSLEDRMVKNFIKTGNVEGDLNKDFFGNVLRPFKEVNRKPIVPNDEEVQGNSRSRSAKMRVAVKLAEVK
ncbi:MAG: 16S rRNA (cytosine1402-N4)-methyltransferase [Flavobacteriales bacterium]|jgi:16S rRNA (cytosine1402-N4)-methyltransferase